MIYHLLFAAAAVAVLAVLWTVVQAWARRRNGEPCEVEDVLACRSCASERALFCGKKPGEYEE